MRSESGGKMEAPIVRASSLRACVRACARNEGTDGFRATRRPVVLYDRTARTPDTQVGRPQRTGPTTTELERIDLPVYIVGSSVSRFVRSHSLAYERRKRENGVDPS